MADADQSKEAPRSVPGVLDVAPTSWLQVSLGSLLVLLCVLALARIAEAGAVAYVTNGGDGTVAVIDADTDTFLQHIRLCAFEEFCNPSGIAIAPGGTRAYVVSREALFLIDTRSNTVAGRVALSGTDLALGADGGLALIAGCAFGAAVCAFDTHQGVVTAVTSVPEGSERVAMSPTGSIAYVTTPVGDGSQPGFIEVFDTTVHDVVQEIALPGPATDVRIHPDGRRAYAIGLPGVLTVIDTNQQAVMRTVDLGAFPRRVALAPDGRRAYVTATDSDSEHLIVVDTDVDSVVGRVLLSSADSGDFGRRPLGVAVTPNGARVYVVQNEDYTVTVIDAQTLTVTGSTPQIGEGPEEIAIAEVPGSGGQGSACSLTSAAHGPRFPGALLLLVLLCLRITRGRWPRNLHGKYGPTIRRRGELG